MYFATKPSYRRTVAATLPWKALITSRRSSGSIAEASAVESTRSQNITVTCRRSACATTSLDGRLGVASANAAPQLPQNLLSGAFSAPHAAQEGGSAAPQSPQISCQPDSQFRSSGNPCVASSPDVSNVTLHRHAAPVSLV